MKARPNADGKSTLGLCYLAEFVTENGKQQSRPKSPFQIVVLVEGEYEGRVTVASRAFVYTNAILLCKNACWAMPKPHLFCIVPMQAARLFQTLL